MTTRRYKGGARLGAVVLFSMAACGPVEVNVPLPAHAFGAAIDSNAFEGVLTLNESCLYLAADDGALNIIWPVGYRLRSGAATVIRDDGIQIATVGDLMQVGGIATDAQIAPPGCPSRRGIFLGVVTSADGVPVAPAKGGDSGSQAAETQRPRPR